MKFFLFLLAAAKLANATLRSNRPSSPDMTKTNSTKHKHHHRHHRKHPSHHPVGSSIRSIGSNGSAGENFSTDEKEEDEQLMTSPLGNHNQLTPDINQDSSSCKYFPLFFFKVILTKT